MTSTDRLAAALAVALAAFASMTLVGTSPVRAGDGTDCQDGECATGPTEKPSRVEEPADYESEYETEDPGFDDADDDGDSNPESETNSEADISDRRLKRDVRLLTSLDNGIRLYAFRYLWSTETHVGVMAQDLVADPRYADAAIMTPSGTYVVDYARLGLRMATFEEWNADGLDAVLLRGRHTEELVALAAAKH